MPISDNPIGLSPYCLGVADALPTDAGWAAPGTTVAPLPDAGVTVLKN